MTVDLAHYGLAVGHATDVMGATGCTVVRGMDAPFRASVHVLGRATGSRELHTADPAHLVERVDALFLTGGSAYGLDAAAGVMRWMEEQGRGYRVGVGVVPIVPAAVIFDLAPLGSATARPSPAMAYAACAAAVPTGFDEGAVGAGTGATVGKVLGFARSMKGGFGCAEVVRGPVRVAAMAVVNALGDVRDATGHILAGARAGEDALADGAFTDVEATLGDVGAGATREGGALQNTTLCVVATNVALDRVQLAQLARIASGALFRRITPVATSSDGDTIFAVAPLTGIAAPPLQVEVLAVRALEHAIERAVRLAHGRDGVPGVADSQVAA